MPDRPLPAEHPEAPTGRSSRDRGFQGRLARDLRQALVDPSEDHDPADRPRDRMAAFGPVVMAMRLATTAVTLLLVAPDLLAGNRMAIVMTLVVTLYALFRSFRPIAYTGGAASVAQVVGEVALHVIAIEATGGWNSPLIFSLITAVSIAGLARGYAFALRVGAAAALAVSLPMLMQPDAGGAVLRQCATWSAMILLVGVVAGLGRRLSGQADRERDLALDRLGRLADANALLYSLHRIAQSLPASLDTNDVLDSTVQRLRSMIDFDVLVVISFDETDGRWSVLRREGCTIPSRLSTADLPEGARAAIGEAGLVSMPALGGPASGFDDRARSGLYVPLSARSSITGLIAIEHREPNRFDHRSGGLLSGLAQPLSLALDNARWFARLRTVGADEERTRIARDLHDRIGQSLAYLAFELDRIVGKERDGDAVGEALERLRGDIRNVIREVRDTLYDLRTDVSEEQSLATTLQQYCERVRERADLRFHLLVDGEHRLPILQEREMWRIAQEAITNVERHARASTVTVTWRCDGERAVLRVSDDGVGFEAGHAGRMDSYGMLGMRERASSIAATLQVESRPGGGTSITCAVDPAVVPVSTPPPPSTRPAPVPARVRSLVPTGGTTP